MGDRTEPPSPRERLAEFFGGESRATIEAALMGELAGAERLLGLPHPCVELRKGVVEATLWCFLVHGLPPLKRYSDIRKELITVQHRTAKAVEGLRKLSQALDELPKAWTELLFKGWARAVNGDDPVLLAMKLDALASLARTGADSLRGLDKGGPRRFLAFEVLVRELAKAFEGGTGKRPTASYSDAKGTYSGKFLELIDAILPQIAKIAEASGRSLARPHSGNARGKYVSDLLRRLRSS
jgi:hypothetical protein